MGWIFLIDFVSGLVTVSVGLLIITLISSITYLIGINVDYLNKHHIKIMLAHIVVIILLCAIIALTPTKYGIANMALEDGFTNDRIVELAKEWQRKNND